MGCAHGVHPTEKGEFRRDEMLKVIFLEMVAMYSDRLHSQTVYSGYGTIIDQMVDGYWEVAGWTSETRRMIRQLDDMAHRRAMNGA